MSESEQNSDPGDSKRATPIWGPLIKFNWFIEQLEQKYSSDKFASGKFWLREEEREEEEEVSRMDHELFVSQWTVWQWV